MTSMLCETVVHTSVFGFCTIPAEVVGVFPSQIGSING